MLTSIIKYVGPYRSKQSKLGFVSTLYSFYESGYETKVANRTHTAYVHTRKPQGGESVYGLPTKNLGEFKSFAKAKAAIFEESTKLVTLPIDKFWLM